ncbi:PIG-L deacetylase family protein [Nguyenibacter sp. L1]|uniref:PIG-L deacetylase family protein n=1 Tax=Nguyenibacter sp. L1 TaxID=3049350 RepID=UPI002B473962|nr:PIG-L deacetylase family protein [Nguyenibacter sp. L1]WRH86817.1 PIG-L deacetylase family protein [Nguyenibacter sp. L1]
MLAPHPDDESLGCGGAIAAASRAGRSVLVVTLTDGRSSHPGSRLFPADRLIALRRDELAEAVRRLTRGSGRTATLGFPDQGAPATSAGQAQAAARLLSFIDRCDISAIWASWEKDPHPDHRCAAAVACAAARARRGLTVWQYPIWGRFIEAALERGATLRVFDTVPFQEEKAAAIAAHRSQMTNLIPDAPGGFVMDERTRRHFLDSPELFIANACHV